MVRKKVYECIFESGGKSILVTNGAKTAAGLQNLLTAKRGNAGDPERKLFAVKQLHGVAAEKEKETHTIRYQTVYGDYFLPPKPMGQTPFLLQIQRAIAVRDIAVRSYRIWCPHDIQIRDGNESRIKQILFDLLMDYGVQEPTWEAFEKQMTERRDFPTYQVCIEPVSSITTCSVREWDNIIVPKLFPATCTIYQSQLNQICSILDQGGKKSFTGYADFSDERLMQLRWEDGKLTAWLVEPGGEILAEVHPEGHTRYISVCQDGWEYRTELVVKNDPNWDTFRKRAYEAYQCFWMMTHGHSIGELLIEIRRHTEDFDQNLGGAFASWEQDAGFGGAIWACYEEFLEAEYQDKDLMRQILSEESYKIWEQDPLAEKEERE